MTKSCYDKAATRGRLDVVRPGKGAGCYALVAVDSLPDTYKAKVEQIYPDASFVRLKAWLKDNFVVDQAAVAFFHDKEKCGVELPPEKD